MVRNEGIANLSAGAFWIISQRPAGEMKMCGIDNGIAGWKDVGRLSSFR
jgi:hypothetical protein